MMKQMPPPPKRIPFTKEGYQNVLDEKAKLLAARPEAVEHLRKAREMGDLSENGYYKASRAKLSEIDGRLRRLERLVRLGRVVEATFGGTVGFGNVVIISDGTKNFEYTVVGGYESDPAKKTVSHISPLGKALFGKSVGDDITVVAPSGIKRYTIQSVR